MRHYFGFMALLALVGCATAPPTTDFVHVIPQRYIPPPATPIPNYTFGWVTTDIAHAESFRVEVGNKQYFTLLARVGPDRIKEELARFAEAEVVARHFCSSENVQTITPELVGPRSGEYMWVGVRCQAP
ncbi:hypothetical protein [Parvibium lacunae]|uniref:DUF4156 domain-containing protein n=1 Tax=Parvibium lacunae TaxID=1888893 RepID=A0A368L705_9BURK|nr:hypothetical protein [Parvibium lacunae]RCS59394.1 hypothetical protein DU000_01275 [Parvibium lacunae]